MQIEIKINDSYTEPKVVILTAAMTEEVNSIMHKLSDNNSRHITGIKDGKITIIDPADLFNIYASNGKVSAVTDNGEYILRIRLYEAEEKLNSDQFVRISNSEIINLKNEFLSRMSHDMRTPLNGIIGMVEMANGNLENAFRVRECHDKIMLSCRNLVELINDILDMQSLTSGTVEFTEENFSLVDMIQGGFLDIRKQAREAGVSYGVELEEFAHPFVRGSQKYIREIFATVLSNAVRYNKEQGNVRITGRELSNGRAVSIYEFVIEDTGLGMSEEFVKRIFDPFEQENNGARTEYQGSGLGMAIAKKIVEVLGGDISIESRLGEGTKVFLTLPLKIVKDTGAENMKDAKRLLAQDAELRRHPEGQAARHRESLAGKKVLLAEDNEINMEIAKYILEDAGIIVLCAKNGQVAVDMFRDSSEGEIDFILMDILMPVMDGITALKEIRKSGDKTYVLMLTAKAEVDDRVTGLDSGADDYLTKPFSLKELLARLRSKERRDDQYTPNEVEVGDLALNVAEQELVSHNSIRLGGKETQLLNYLMLNEGKEFSTSDLLAHVWKDDNEASEDVVWIYISYLRQKLQSIQSSVQIGGEKGGSFSLIR